ncbi:MAG: hypothetical protein FWD50_00670 [Betaproteobacteria bacterium]|nr:hypothetical protein [Betaproteobacteria bacterium]
MQMWVNMNLSAAEWLVVMLALCAVVAFVYTANEFINDLINGDWDGR